MTFKTVDMDFSQKLPTELLCSAHSWLLQSCAQCRVPAPLWGEHSAFCFSGFFSPPSNALETVAAPTQRDPCNGLRGLPGLGAAGGRCAGQAAAVPAHRHQRPNPGRCCSALRFYILLGEKTDHFGFFFLFCFKIIVLLSSRIFRSHWFGQKPQKNICACRGERERHFDLRIFTCCFF